VSRIVRFGAGALEELPDVCRELGVDRPLLVTTRRGAASAAGRIDAVGVYDGVRPHVPAETVDGAAALARKVEADSLVGLGGGSAIDTCKAAAARLGEGVAGAAGGGPVPDEHTPPSIVAVPTTYAGAEWTAGFGMLVAPGRKEGGTGVAPAAALYDPELTLELPLGASVGTAMNALAHCAEAYYHPAANDGAALDADAGAAAISAALPLVAADLGSLDARTRLLEGAMHAALALGDSGLCLAHAMAQALGGRYGLPQGTMNAICLPVALRFNEATVPDAVARFGAALGASDAVTRCEELAGLGGFGSLRSFGVPLDELPDVAGAIAARPGARQNPRPVSAADAEALLRAIW
jgi:maleylacetate reductase